MNHSVLRKLAASTATICQHMGNSVDMFFILKALYLADRQMVSDYGVPITGDNYSSMPKGPILSGAYNLMTASPGLRDAKTQAEWDAVFVKKVHAVSVREGKSVDTDCLSPAEEEILKEKIMLVIGLHQKGVRVAEWMHQNCPEWEEVPQGSSKVLPMERLVQFATNVDESNAKKASACIKDAIALRQLSLTSKQPILVAQ